MESQENGAGVEFKIKEGPITLLSINSTYDGKFKFIIAEGESVNGSHTSYRQYEHKRILSTRCTDIPEKMG